MFISRIVARRASVEVPRLAPTIALMDGNPLLNPVGSLPPQVYWRRRVLAAAVVVLVVWFAWSWLPGGGASAASPAKPKTTPTAGTTSAPATTAAPAAVTTSAAPATTVPPTIAATVTSPAAVLPATTTAASCAASSLKVTLSADHTVYAAGVEPHFVLTVSNVGTSSCQVDVGTANRGFLVTSGSDRIWSSLDCAKNSANVQTFKAGATVSYATVWGRQRSSTGGCAAKGVDARAGTYVVQAHLGDLVTGKAVFRLT
jgi:hypothetical protein